MKKLKVLLFPLSSFISHVTRCLCIADELRTRGHQVEFASSETNKDLIMKAGYTTHIVRQLCHDQIVVTGAPKEYLQRYRENNADTACLEKFGLKEMASDDLEVLKKVKPDLVICDASPTSYLAATVLGIPCIMVKNILGYIDSSLSEHALSQGIDLTDELDFTLEVKMSNEFKTDCIKLNQAFIEKYKTIPFIIPGVPEFEKINDINIFENMSHCFVGNFDWKGWEKNIKPKANKYKDKTIILVTMGSSFPFEELLLNILKAFPDDPYHIIINTGGQVDISKIKSNQTNFEIFPYLSLNDFLEISDILVYHGGHGSTMSALKAGIPSVVIPFNGDQMVISKQIEKFKCGIRIKKYPDDITSIELHNAIKEVLLDDCYKENALKYGELVKAKGSGAINAADFIEDFYSLRKWEDKVSQEFLELVLSRQEKQSKKELKILFAVDDNRWHTVSSCICIAHTLRANGSEIGFLVSGKNKIRIENLGFQAFVSNSLTSKLLTGINIHESYSNNFIEDNQIEPTKLKSMLRKMVKDDLNVFCHFKPNLVIDAGRMSASISSGHLQVPSVKFHTFNNSINDSIKGYPNSKYSKQAELLGEMERSIEDLKTEFFPPPKLKGINYCDHPLLEPVLTPIVPSFMINVLNGENNKQSVVYLGSLGSESEDNRLTEPNSIYMDTTVILVLLTDVKIYENVIRHVLNNYNNSKFKIIIIQEKSIKRFFKDIDTKNIEWIRNPLINKFLKISDVVIHNGNYENTLLALKHRIPSMMIPYFKDEFKFSEELEKNQWGVVIKEYPSDIKQKTITKNINDLLKRKEQMQENMIKVSGELSIWDNGGKRGAFVIEDFYRQLVNLQTN